MIEQKDKKLLSITNDYVFRRIFGDKNISALADFLAGVFDMTVEQLGELKVDDPHIHRNRKRGKSNILDIRVHTKNDEIINVEIQINPEERFRERLVYLNSKTFSDQMEKGQDYSKLNRTITVVIADFELLEENRDCLNMFRWYNLKNKTMLTKAQEIDVLELPKLSKDDDGSRLWKWLRFFKSGKEDEMEELSKDSKEMQKVMISLREMSEDEYERRLAEQNEKDERDRRAEIAYGHNKGKAEGNAEGKIEGKKEACQDIVRRMKEKGFSQEEIIDITGVKEEDIAKL